MEADISTQAVGLASSADFSLMNLFIRADIIVKSVIILLIACSIYSWAVIIEKFRLFKKTNETSQEFETKFWNSKSAETFYNNLPANIEDPMALVFKDAMQSLLKRKSKSDLNNRITTLLETGILTANDIKKELITSFKFKKDNLIDQLDLVSREDFDALKKLVEKQDIELKKLKKIKKAKKS